ncbi:multiple epidermal growth factor-like domains protein 6, partial [Solea solea]|uniref:multiple epidermal growth factor-like domains protein 6 n=1 Tax=Solea solea TaxID=90069 RepID=UPI00272C35E7
MQRTCRWLLRWLFSTALLTLAHTKNFSQHNQEKLSCQQGFYCPVGSISPFPCPKGTYGPAMDALSIDNCLKCPPHHYCPRPGLSSPYFCGPMAQQPLPGQDTCICPGEGQSFQISNGWCQCTIGYQPANNGDVCVHKRYEVCRDGQTRTQHGDCLDKHQWSLHCRQVCQSAEDYQGYDRELGLCVCREPPG